MLFMCRNATQVTDLGTMYKQDLIAKESSLTVLRDKMIRDMEARGVNPKYLGEMRNVDIRKMLQR